MTTGQGTHESIVTYVRIYICLQVYCHTFRNNMGDEVEISDLISDALRKVYRFTSDINYHLNTSATATGDKTYDRVIQQAAEVTARVLAAMKDHRNGISPRQSRLDPPGVCWIDTVLPRFMYSLHRIVFDPSYLNTEVKDLVNSNGFDAMDSINGVMMDSRLQAMPLGPSSHMMANTDGGPAHVVVPAQERFICPAEGCTKTFGSEKAKRQHVKKFHSVKTNDDEEVKEKEEEGTTTSPIETTKGRVACALCVGDKKNMVETLRMKEHLVRVHKRGPYLRGQKV